MLADFARTGGVAVAKVIMADFARRASEEFAKDTPAHTASEPDDRLSSSVEPQGGTAGNAAGAATGAAIPTSRIETAPHPDVAVGSAAPGSAAASVGQTGPATAARHPGPVPSQPEPAALSATGLLWAVMKAQFLRLAQRFGLAARDGLTGSARCGIPVLRPMRTSEPVRGELLRPGYGGRSTSGASRSV